MLVAYKKIIPAIPFVLMGALDMLLAAVLVGWGIQSFGTTSPIFAVLPPAAIFFGAICGVVGALSLARCRGISTVTSAQYTGYLTVLLFLSPPFWLAALLLVAGVAGAAG